MRGFAAVGLFNPKTDFNVGSALRAAFCYEAATVNVVLYDRLFKGTRP